ncbi:hypothetical protein Y032_0608g597 [Ancylostoma ceylanicum]|uniref:Uncharacterized protein n=1 Tax=Ancylostoma ceylanicum TaxID=53326 RepID=A0A016WND7_9BILA|nr:hypothetical protein Y032_0608g597 [Ancylostoma ceylanicum]
MRAIQCFVCSWTRHVKSWKLSAISDWKRAKTCLAYNNWRDLPHLGSLPSGKICETDSMYRLSETTSPPTRSRIHACQQSTSSSLVCVSRFIVIFMISANDLPVTWTAWADSSFRIHCISACHLMYELPL